MNKQSRTAKSIKNSSVALCFFCIDFVLKFFSRGIFLNALGTELLGLNSTMMNLLQFLNLAELGIGAAIGFTLYKPIADNDTNSINEIIQLNGLLYRRIAYLIGIGAIILMPFFPLIFGKTNLPLIYPYATFIVFMVGLILNYCINYKQILLSAAQMDYKIQYSYKSVHIFKTVCQILAVSFMSYPYFWWLAIEFLFSIVASVSLDLTIRKTFTFLRGEKYSFKFLAHKYAEISKKVKQVFFHKIGGFVMTQTSPLIIYGFLSLTVVTYYMNYVIITSGFMQLFNAMFNSMTNSIGNLVAEGNTEKTIRVFNELFSLRFFIVGVCCFSLVILIKPFIIMWIGVQYVLPTTTLIIIIATLFIMLSRSTVEAFLNAYGMYHDIWSPVTEALLNISLSILLGIHYGLNGILCGTLISLLVIVCTWKPYFLFTQGFKTSVWHYIRLYVEHVLIFTATAGIWYICKISLLPGYEDGKIWSFVVYSISNIAVILIVSLSLMVLSKMPIIMSIKRIVKKC